MLKLMTEHLSEKHPQEAGEAEDSGMACVVLLVSGYFNCRDEEYKEMQEEQTGELIEELEELLPEEEEEEVKEPDGDEQCRGCGNKGWANNEFLSSHNGLCNKCQPKKLEVVGDKVIDAEFSDVPRETVK